MSIPSHICHYTHTILWFIWILWIVSQYYTVVGERHKFFAILQCDFGFVWQYLSMKFGTKWWAMIQLCLAKSEMLLSYQTRYPHLLPIHSITVNGFKNSLTGIIYTFSLLFSLCPNLFGVCGSHHNQTFSHLQNTFTLVSEIFSL